MFSINSRLGRPLLKNVWSMFSIYSRYTKATTVGECVVHVQYIFQMYQGNHCRRICGLCLVYILVTLGRPLQKDVQLILGIISRCIRATTVGEYEAYPWHNFSYYGDHYWRMCDLCFSIYSRCTKATTVGECVAYVKHIFQMYLGDHCRIMCSLCLA